MTIENRLLAGDSDEAMALAMALGLPAKNLKSFTFAIKAGDVATLTAVYYVNEDACKKFTTVLGKRYRLLEIE